MLYDKKWDQKVKETELSLDGLIAWLETMPPEGEYDWYSIKGCVFCQYQKAAGKWVKHIEFEYLPESRYDYHLIGANNTETTSGTKADWTFGKALERARKVQARET